VPIQPQCSPTVLLLQKCSQALRRTEYCSFFTPLSVWWGQTSHSSAINSLWNYYSPYKQ